jgi:hypothetical protein
MRGFIEAHAAWMKQGRVRAATTGSKYKALA